MPQCIVRPQIEKKPSGAGPEHDQDRPIQRCTAFVWNMLRLKRKIERATTELNVHASRSFLCVMKNDVSNI